MEERTIRVKNLKELVTKAGGIASFARTYSGIDPTYISQLINGHRNFGERAARNMEEKIGIPRGALDFIKQLPETINKSISKNKSEPKWPFSNISPDAYNKLDHRDKEEIERTIAMKLEYYDLTQQKRAKAR